MGKQTKRARKFSSKGGVQARLEKGTVTNKGKLKRKRKGDGNQGASKKMDLRNHEKELQQKKREENDFSGEANLGGMDMESFFESFAEKMEQENQDSEVDSVSDDDGDNDDGDDDDEAEQEDEVAHEDDKDDDNEDNASVSVNSEDEEDVDVASERMKREMRKLQSSDPEFHKFLAENEESLLDFGEEQENEDDHNEDEDDEDVSSSRNESGTKSAYTVVDAIFLKKMDEGAFKSHGIKSLKKLVGAYKAACHLSDANHDEDGEKKMTGPKKYHIEGAEAFDQLMVMCLSKCHKEFEYHLVGKEDGKDDSEAANKDDEPLNSKIIARSPRWNELKPTFESFMKSTLNVLTHAKEPELLTFMLKALSKYVRFLTIFPRISERLLKILTGLWSAPLDSNEDYQVVRLHAFIRIRQLAMTQPFPFIEACLKKTYLAYANRAKFGTSASVTSVLPTLTFMGNCVVELYSLDYHSSYQHTFVYVRQLALHLRTAIQKKTPEALQAVYCWQYIHCLKLWVAVITASCTTEGDVRNEDDVKLLRSLVFPLSQVILGVVRLVPTTRYLPLRLHCVRFLQQLAAAAQVFIPTTSIVLEVLGLKEIGLRPKKIQGRGGARGLQLALILKLPKESPLRTSEHLEACVSEVFLLLNREVELYRYSAGFPEFSVVIRQRLKKVRENDMHFCVLHLFPTSYILVQFSKETKNMRWRAYSKGCIDVCDRYSDYAVKEIGRAHV